MVELSWYRSLFWSGVEQQFAPKNWAVLHLLLSHSARSMFHGKLFPLFQWRYRQQEKDIIVAFIAEMQMYFLSGLFLPWVSALISMPPGIRTNFVAQTCRIATVSNVVLYWVFFIELSSCSMNPTNDYHLWTNQIVGLIQTLFLLINIYLKKSFICSWSKTRILSLTVSLRHYYRLRNSSIIFFFTNTLSEE